MLHRNMISRSLQLQLGLEDLLGLRRHADVLEEAAHALDLDDLAYALAGRIDVDLSRDPIGEGKDGKLERAP